MLNKVFKISLWLLPALLFIALWLVWAFQAKTIPWALSVWPEFSSLMGWQWILKVEKRGAWGDSFGALNALISTFAFLGVIVTLRLQQIQTAGAQSDLHRQRFEAVFFELMSMIREERARVRFRYTEEYQKAKQPKFNDTKRGLFAFRSAYREMRYWVEASHKAGKFPSRSDLVSLYDHKVHNRYESTFGPYYRLVYGALDRIRSDKFLTDDEKVEFGNLLRAQMSSFEVVVAGFNGLSGVSKDFDRLIVQFRLLKYAQRGTLYDVLEAEYEKEAFLGRNELAPLAEESGDDVDIPDDDDLEEPTDVRPVKG